VLPFRCLPLPSPLGIVAPIRTVNMPAIAGSTQKEKSPTPVTDALNLPEIVQPVSTTAGNSATTGDSCDNAVVERVQPAATRGSEVVTPGPLFLVRSGGSSNVTLNGANYTDRASCPDFRAFRCPSTSYTRGCSVSVEFSSIARLRRLERGGITQVGPTSYFGAESARKPRDTHE